MEAQEFARRVAGIAALAEPIRRGLYGYVIAQREPVTRDAAATALKLPHHIAKFHLDRLVDDGLLEADFKRPAGRSGPGAGRPTKRYRRATEELGVSLPPRRYDLAGDLMAAAIEQSASEGAPVLESLASVARERGSALGAEMRAGGAGDREGVCAALGALGYEPRDTEAGVELVNCPFHALAVEHTDLVCGMNLDFVRAAVDASGASGLHAQLAPEPGRCCVVLTTD